MCVPLLSILARTCDHVRLTGSTLFVRAETSLLQLLSAKGDGVVSVLDDPLRYMRYDQDPLHGAEGAVVRAHRVGRRRRRSSRRSTRRLRRPKKHWNG